jgi:hypothetical protein
LKLMIHDILNYTLCMCAPTLLFAGSYRFQTLPNTEGV